MPDDEKPQATITPYRNGPYLLRGDFTILDQDGNEIETGRETVALCRCGRSRSKPFCDGTHKAIRFSADSEADELRPLTPPEELAAPCGVQPASGRQAAGA